MKIRNPFRKLTAGDREEILFHRTVEALEEAVHAVEEADHHLRTTQLRVQMLDRRLQRLRQGQGQVKEYHHG